MSEACKTAGPLDERTVELVKLGISIGAAAEGAARSPARRAMTGFACVRDVTKGGW